MRNSSPQTAPSIEATLGNLGILADHGAYVVRKDGATPALDALLVDAEFAPRHPMLRSLRAGLAAGDSLTEAVAKALPTEPFIQQFLHYAELTGSLPSGLLFLGRIPRIEADALSPLESACRIAAGSVELGIRVDTAICLAAIRVNNAPLRTALIALADGIRRGASVPDSVRGTFLERDIVAQNYLTAAFDTGDAEKSLQCLADIECARARNLPPPRLFALVLGHTLELGVPILHALEVALPAADPKLQLAIQDVINDIRRGYEPEESIARKQQSSGGGDGFAPTFVAAFSAGIQSGGLEAALLRYGRMVG